MNINYCFRTCIFMCLFLIISINNTQAQKPLSKASSYSHLLDVNNQWEKYKQLSPQSEIYFNNEEDRISFHLNLVIKNLKKNNPTQFSEEITQKRVKLLNELALYANKKEFPTNSFHSKRTPYFVDNKGVHCAVGYLMAVSGNNELVQQISLEHNYDYIEDIKTEGVLAWANDNGFTIDELKWIQPTYGLPHSYKTLSNGSNGLIKKSEKYYKSKTFIAYAGQFDSLDLMPCLNIGYYDGEKLSCYGNGVKGQINDITFGQELFIGGILENNNSIYSLAKYNNNGWEYFNIPNRVGNEVTAIDANSNWLNGLNLSLKSTEKANHSEIWNLKNNYWNKIASLNGIVLDLKNTEMGYVYAGHFDTVIIHHQSNLMLDDTIITHNAIMHNNFSNEWFSFGNQISDTVFDFESTDNSIIFAGNCAEPNDICLSKFLNNDLQPLILKNHFADSTYTVIKDIQFQSGKLYYAGKFTIQEAYGESGTNYGNYNFTNNQSYALSTINNMVNTISFYEAKITLGGDFSGDVYNPNILYLAQFDKFNDQSDEFEIEPITPIDTIEEEKILDLKFSPNPFNTEISIINAGEGDYNYFLYNSNGNLLSKGKTTNHKITNLDYITTGIYILKIENKTTEYVQKVIKK